MEKGKGHPWAGLEKMAEESPMSLILGPLKMKAEVKLEWRLHNSLLIGYVGHSYMHIGLNG